MKAFYMLSMTIFVTGTTAFASLDGFSADEIVQSEIVQTRQAQADGIYMNQLDNNEVVPLAIWQNGKRMKNSKQITIGLEKGEPVAVKFKGNGNAIVSILVDDAEKAYIPQKFEVSADDAIDLDLAFVSPGDASTLAAQYSEFANTDSASRNGGHARARVHSGRSRLVYTIGGAYSASGCLGYVEQQVRWDKQGGVGGASNFAAKLHSVRGYSVVSCSNPTEGTVGSWSGKHVAIFQGGCWRYDIGCGPPGKGYGHLKLCVHS